MVYSFLIPKSGKICGSGLALTRALGPIGITASSFAIGLVLSLRSNALVNGFSGTLLLVYIQNEYEEQKNFRYYQRIQLNHLFLPENP